MKQIWKRTASLMLSGALLLSSMPLPALATEETTVPTEPAVVETQPIETEPVQTQPIETQPQETQAAQPAQEQTVVVLTSGENVADTTAVSSKLEVFQNGETVDAAWLSQHYNQEKNQLTLGEETIDSVEFKDAENPLKIILTEETFSVIDGSLTALKGIEITGPGTLKVGNIAAGENLTIKNAVIQVGDNIAPLNDDSGNLPLGREAMYLINVKNQIEISGAAHVATAHDYNAIKFGDSESKSLSVGQGFYRTSHRDEFTRVDGEITNDVGSYFEFVSDAHLKAEYEDADKHALACKKVNGEQCFMNVSGIAPEDHVETTAAGCGEAAYCGVCESRYGDVSNDHSGQEQWQATAQKHTKKYSCCNETFEEADHSFVYAEGNAVITKKCDICEYSETVLEVKAPTSLVWDSTKKEVSVVTEISEDDYEVVYYLVVQLGEDELPMDKESTDEETSVNECINPGTYRAYVTVTIEGKEYKLQKEFTIAPITLTAEMVTLSKESDVFAGLNSDVTPPTATVKYRDFQLTKGTHYTVEYYLGTSKVTSFNVAGDYKIKIVGKEPYVSGWAEKTFRITKAAPTADMFAFTAPSALTYDGTVKTATVEAQGSYEAGMGDVTVKYYKNNTLVEGSVIDAGVYTVKISVAAGENYAATTEDLNKAEWTFTIAPADVSAADAINRVYTDHTVEQQLVVVSMGGFAGPSFTGYTKSGAEEADLLTGTVTYTYGTDNKTTTDISVLNSYLSGLPDGTMVTVGYELTPDGENYTGTTQKRTVSLTKATIVVKVNGVAGTPEQIGQAIKMENPRYGDQILDCSKLTVHMDNTSEPIPGTFSVKYSKLENGNYGEKIALDKPDAGSYKFYVYFSNVNREVSAIQNVLVATGDVRIGKQDPSITLTAVADLTDDNGGDPLVTVTSNGETIKYSTDGGVNWSDSIPVVPAQRGSGVFSVKYKVVDDGNFNAKSDYAAVEVVVRPYLTAVYGTTLAQIQIESDVGTWAFEEPNETKVGSVNETGNPHNMSFTPRNTTTATKTGYPVNVYVSAAHITLDVNVEKSHYSYNSGNEIKPNVEVKEKVNSNAGDVTPLDPFPKTEYELAYSNNKNPGKATVTISSKGNYIFDNPTEDLTKEFVIYRIGHLELKDDASAVPPELKDEAGTKYATGADIKTVLAEKYDENQYPKNRRTYVKYVMMNEGTSSRYDEYYWPNGGSGTLKWEYDNGVTKDDNFKIYGMYMVTSDRLGTEAGEIFEMTEKTSGSLGVNEFYVGTDGIELKLKNYAILCFAAEVDTTKEYAISKSIVYDGQSSTKGSLTIKVDSKTADKATYGKTVEVTASANSGYSIQSVKVTDASGNTVDTNQSGTKYTFTMPASDVTVKLSLKKTTSNTKNPGSGDTSNIHLWLTVLVASGVGIAALMAFWFKKRKK